MTKGKRKMIKGKAIPVFLIILILLLLLSSCEKRNAIESVLTPSYTKVSEEYPSKPITIIVAYKQGGGTDTIARKLVAKIEKNIMVKINIKNISGSDGELGYTQLAKSSPDGYTLGFINIPTMITLPLKRETSYNENEIAPIINIVYDPSVIAVRSDSQIKTFSSFLTKTKENPYLIKVGNNGYGASNHIAAAFLADKADIKISHIPFGGSADMIKALNDGNVDAIAVKISEVANEVKRGTFRLLASFTDERINEYQDVPTLKEYGIDLVFGSARALAAPADTPEEIIKYIHDEVKKAIEELSAEDSNNTLSLKYMSTEEIEEYIKMWQEYIQASIPYLPL